MSERVVASYCADFLKADMQHIYRQVGGLRRWRARVITHRRENEALFPWPAKHLRVLPRHPLRFFRRLWHRQVCGRQVPPTLGEVREFLYQVLRFEARLLHVYFGHIAVRWLPLLRACPRPVVVSFHGADVGVGVTGAGLREVFRHARLVLARSEALLDDLRAQGCPEAKLRLQRTGIPLEFWRPPDGPRLPPADGAWRWVQACRLVEKKGLHTTLHAFREVAGRHPAARLTLVGEGPQRGALEEAVCRLGLAGRVELPGFLPPEQVLEQYHRAHLFLHPSQTTPDGNREGVPNSLLEAMATGLPVLATRHGGIPEAVSDGRSGHLVTEGDAAGLAAAATALMEDPGAWQAASREAVREVAEKFERSRQIARLEAIYDEAAGLPPA